MICLSKSCLTERRNKGNMNRMVGILCVDSTVTISIQPQFRYSFGDFGNLSWFR